MLVVLEIGIVEDKFGKVGLLVMKLGFPVKTLSSHHLEISPPVSEDSRPPGDFVQGIWMP